MDFIIIFRITPHSCNKGVTSSSTDKNLYQNGIILITFAIRKSSCKPACGTFALEQRRSRLYVLRIVALPSFIGYWYILRGSLITWSGIVTYLCPYLFVQLIVYCGRVITFAIQPTKCKPACGAAALEQRRSRLYVRGFRPPSRRFAVWGRISPCGEEKLLHRINAYPPQDFAFSGKE